MTEYALGVDLQTAAFRRAMESEEFRSLIRAGIIGYDAASDAPDEEKVATGWVFQGLSKEGKPYRDPEGSGAAVVCFISRTTWTGANSHNTAKFPQLQCLVYADSTRNEDGSEASPDAFRRGMSVLKVLDRLFHLPQHTLASQQWPGMAVHSSLSAGGFDTQDVPNTQDLVVRIEQRYNAITDELIV